MTLFWLVLVTSAIATPLHVGNFPNLETCQQAAFSSQQTMRDAPGNTNFSTRVRAGKHRKGRGP